MYYELLRIFTSRFALQMHVPNWVKLYGSQYVSLQVGSHYKLYRYRMTISKSHLRAMDQPSERCSDDPQTPKATTCIANFIEKQMGCNLRIQGSESPAHSA